MTVYDKFIQSTLMASVLAFTLGCSKSRPKESGEHEFRGHQDIQGPLVETVKEIDSNVRIEDCDERLQKKRAELAQAIDNRTDEIENYIAQTANPNAAADPNHKFVKVGDLVFNEKLNVKTGQDIWESDVDSWEGAYKSYEKIKGLPVDYEWVDLNSRVRSLLRNDKFRVIRDVNMYLDKDSEPALTVLAELLYKCKEDKNCTSLELSQDLKTFIQNQPDFAMEFRNLERATTKIDKRKIIELFENRVQIDLEDTFGFYSNKTVTKIAEGSWQLPVLAPEGYSEEDLSKIKSYSDEFWKNDQYAIKIKWIHDLAAPDIFKLIMSAVYGERPFVSSGKKTINFFSGMRTRSIPHEIGHVLGFSDEYYTVWNDKDCTYTEQYNLGNLMSNSATGIVVNDHWKKISEHY